MFAHYVKYVIYLLLVTPQMVLRNWRRQRLSSVKNIFLIFALSVKKIGFIIHMDRKMRIIVLNLVHILVHTVKIWTIIKWYVLTFYSVSESINIGDWTSDISVLSSVQSTTTSKKNTRPMRRSTNKKSGKYGSRIRHCTMLFVKEGRLRMSIALPVGNYYCMPVVMIWWFVENFILVRLVDADTIFPFVTLKMSFVVIVSKKLLNTFAICHLLKITFNTRIAIPVLYVAKSPLLVFALAVSNALVFIFVKIVNAIVSMNTLMENICWTLFLILIKHNYEFLLLLFCWL